MDTQKQQFERSVDRFREITGMGICLRLLAPPLSNSIHRSVMSGYQEHKNPFCKKQKRRKLDKCTKSCHQDMLANCDRNTACFEHVCHANLHELIFPIYSEDILIAVLHVGPFLRNSDKTSMLPVLSEEKLDAIRDLSWMLKSFVIETGRRVRDTLQLDDTRRNKIESFLDRHVKMDPVLGDLADYLSLSSSRTSHLVKETTGLSFRELKEQRRIKMAKNLLTNSNAKIKWIADQCGFEDVNYFSRFFKLKTNMPPSRFRSAYQNRLDI